MTATLLVVIAVLAALFPPTPRSRQARSRRSAWRHGDHRQPLRARGRSGRAGAHGAGAPRRDAVDLAVVCAVLVPSPAAASLAVVGCRDRGGDRRLRHRTHGVAPAPVGTTPSRCRARHADHVHDGRAPGPPTLKAYAFPVWFFAVAVTMSPGVRRFISRRTGLRILAVSLGTLRTTELRRSRATRRRSRAARPPVAEGGHQRGDLAAAEPLLQAAVDAAGGRRGAGLGAPRGERRGAHRLASESSVPSSFGRRFEREWVATNANEVQMSLEDDIRRVRAGVRRGRRAARRRRRRAAEASAPEAAVARARRRAARRRRRRRARRRRARDSLVVAVVVRR